MQQYPTNVEQQQILIRQLQDQHYQQYMQQMVQHQLHQQPQYPNPQASPGSGMQRDTNNQPPLSELDQLTISANHATHASATTYRSVEGNAQALEQAVELSTRQRFEVSGNHHNNDDEEDDEEPVSEGNYAPAQMWTRKEHQLFKDAITKEGGDGIIKVGHGEIVTVRVPTHPEGSCIFWEFATDSYDIGFGLLFEWTSNPGHQVSVHVSESEDSEEDEDEEAITAEVIANAGDDPEKAGALATEKGYVKDDGPPCSVIIPIYRRDSHEEVSLMSYCLSISFKLF